MGLNFLYQTCSIHRNSTQNAAGKSYVDKTTSLVGTYPCRLSRQSGGSVITTSNQPQTLVTSYMRAYMDIGADVKEGDRLDCDGKRYRVTLVYAPNNHHLEVDLQMQGVEA